MIRYSLLLVLLFVTLGLRAQTPSTDSLQRDVNADPRLKTAVGKHIETNANAKMKGWRVQIHYGADNDRAKSIKSKFLGKYASEAHAYITYDAPNFKVRVGDFRTQLEAYRFLKKIKAEYPEAFIVECEIEKPPIR
ncbi:MAG: SPOR domain-containing protein [Bacteroidetes bacterium]|nr:SPOR domain-containing protein [Bacteroidota bacterium]